MSGGDTGWVALAGQIVGNLQQWEIVYYWDYVFHPTKAQAIKAGFSLANGTDDFNVGKVENGQLVWFGWMDDKHPEEDYAEVAAQFDWTAPDIEPASTSRLGNTRNKSDYSVDTSPANGSGGEVAR